MKKRLTALVLALAMAGTLSACGPKEPTITETEDGLVFDKKLELTVWETQGTDYTTPQQPEENVVQDWLIAKTNTEVTSIFGNGGGQWDAKLTKLVAGGNLPDIVHCGAGQGPAHFKKLDELEQLWTLTPEMLQKYAPNAWKRIPQNIWDKMTVDGKILGIPYYIKATEESHPDATPEDVAFMNESKIIPNNDMTYVSSQCLWIRDDIAKMFFPEAKTYDELVALMNEKNEPIGDELLDIPVTSTEQYIKLMYDIKALNLKENGKTVYAFGYDGSDNWCALSWLGADMYGYKGHYYTGTWNDKTQRIEIPVVGETIRQAAKTQNQMVLDEVIEMESLAHTSALYKEKVLNGQYAIVPIDLVGSAESVNKQLADMGKTFRYRPFITQVPAMEQYGAYKSESAWGESLCLLKSLSEEELIQALNWIDTQFSDEYEEVLNWGPAEAGLYTENEDGTRTFVDERFNDYFINQNTSALDKKETKGLGGVLATRTTGLFSLRIGTWSRWSPSILNRVNSLVPSMASGFKFKQDSPHVTSVKEYPPCQVWDSIYAAVPEVVTFWAERESWENGFKLALAADPGEFDAKWDKAVAAVHDLVDVTSMEDQMTEIAKNNMP